MGGDDPVSRAWDDTVGKNSYIGGGQAGKDIEAVGQKYIDAIVDPYKNLAYAVSSGNYNNLDKSLLDIATAGATGGLIPGLPGFKETGIERATREAVEQAKSNAEAAAAEKERLRLQGIADFMTASVNARRLRPGSAQTTGGLLSASSSDTLLTVGG